MRYRKTYVRKGTRVAGRCIRSQTRATESSKNKTKRILGRMTRRLRGIRIASRSYKGDCGKGMILRKPYVRYTKRGKRVVVKEGCIRNLGAPGKGLRSSLRNSLRNPGIGPLRKGDLAQFGYVRVASMSVADRHVALKKAIVEYGSLTVWRKLNAVYVYTRRTSPSNSRIFKEDMDWIRSVYGLKAF